MRLICGAGCVKCLLGPVRTKKPPKAERLAEAKEHNSCLAQRNIACYCQQQNPLFVKYKRKPSFVIKLPHRPISKPEPSNHFHLYAIMITEMGIKKQAKSACAKCKCLLIKSLRYQRGQIFLPLWKQKSPLCGCLDSTSRHSRAE